MTTELLIALSGVFVATAVLVAWATGGWLAAHAPEHLRLRALLAGAFRAAPPQRPLAEEPDPFLAQLTKLIPKSPQDMTRLQRRLTRAGHLANGAAVYFSAAELALAAGGAVVAFVLASGLEQKWMLVFCGAAIGYLLPQWWLAHRISTRQRAIVNGLPDALDLMTLCVEAGSGLDQSIAKTAKELEIAHPILAHELRLVVTETRAGKPRLEAFRNFAERTDVDDVTALSGMLAQTDRFGTSIGQALRTQAAAARTRRRQRAEERAGRISVKLVFPLALCMLPALVVVAFGPAAIKIYHGLIEPQFR